MPPIHIENEIFKRAKPIPSRLLAYGFKLEDGSYVYSTSILNGSFRMDIKIDCESRLYSQIIDLDFNEEYTNFRLENQIGEFVNKVKDEHKRVLLDIKNKCYEDIHFFKEQSNRIVRYIKKQYGDEPEFLWEDEPGFGIFRNSITQKWYALIMNLDKKKLTKRESIEIEVMNLKLPQEEIDSLIDERSYFRAYHMNKKYWITILLDESLTDEEILDKVKTSHELSMKKK